MSRQEHIKYRLLDDHFRGYVDYNACAGVSEEQYYLPKRMVNAPTITTSGMTKIIVLYEV